MSGVASNAGAMSLGAVMSSMEVSGGDMSWEAGAEGEFGSSVGHPRRVRALNRGNRALRYMGGSAS